MDQRLAGLGHNARQPRPATEADVQADTKTCERMEGAAKAVQAMHGDSFSANRSQAGPKTTSTSFGVKAEPLALLCRDDVVVENGATAPKSCLSPLAMRSTPAAGGLLPAGKVSTTTRIAFYQPRLWFCQTEEMDSERTSTLYALYNNSSFSWNQLPVPSWRGVIQTK